MKLSLSQMKTRTPKKKRKNVIASDTEESSPGKKD